MYRALYRKWRPRDFSGVAGQEHVTETLRQQISSGRLSHAYLFVGTRGTGKTTCAKILSRAVNCENPQNGNPCNVCTPCRGIEDGSILDVLELDAASNNGVDNVRALREEAVYSPASTKKRVYIVDEVHMLTPAAFNALLKILEEPPEHVLFILATTELHKVPATILSRCQRFSFRRISQVTISDRLLCVAESEGFTLTRDAALKLSSLADGSMRDALSLLDQCSAAPEITLESVLDTLGLAGNGELLALASAVFSREVTAALSVLDTLYAGGKDMAALLSELGALFRDALVNKLSQASPLLSGGFDGSRLASATADIQPERLLYCLEVVRDTALSLTRGGGARLAAELCVIRLCDERLSTQNSGSVLSRISRLEEFLANNASAPVSGGAKPGKKTGSASAETVRPEDIAPWEDETAPEEPVERPVPPAAPVPVETRQDGGETRKSSGGFWHDILAVLKSDIAAYSLLSDDKQVTAELRGAVLNISVGSAFAVSAAESKTVMEPLRAAAQKTLGREITVKVSSESGVKPADKSAKLERLNAFDIITFE